MGLLDINCETTETTILRESRVLSSAIYEIYKEADQKRAELIKTVDAEVSKYALPSYQDLRKELFIDNKCKPNYKPMHKYEYFG